MIALFLITSLMTAHCNSTGIVTLRYDAPTPVYVLTPLILMVDDTGTVHEVTLTKE